MFTQKGLQIIIECNLKVVNYLDVTFNLNDGSYRPYRKSNDETHYIHIQSDHPPSITKQLPRSIEKRLSQLSSSKYIFSMSVLCYIFCLFQQIKFQSFSLFVVLFFSFLFSFCFFFVVAFFCIFRIIAFP